MKEQLGHGSIQITVDTYGHLIPGANRAAVDRLDHDAPEQPDATQTQPASRNDAGTVAKTKELFRKSGETTRIEPLVLSLGRLQGIGSAARGGSRARSGEADP